MAVVGRRITDRRPPGMPCSTAGPASQPGNKGRGTARCCLSPPITTFLSLSIFLPGLLFSKMRSTTALLVLLAHLFALTAAHRDWWLKSLPTCWQSCFADTEDGCSSSSCKTGSFVLCPRVCADRWST